jgi:hypothetical protein
MNLDTGQKLWLLLLLLYTCAGEATNKSDVSSAKTFAGGSVAEPARISVGLLVPHTTFRVREYSRAVSSTISSLRRQELTFLQVYRFQPSDVHTDMLKFNPSPTGKLHPFPQKMNF